LRDYAFRLEGLVLADVYLNFYSAWNRADLLPLLRAISNAKANPLKTLDAPSAKPVPAALAKRGKDAQALRLQVLRTQPEEGYDDAEQCWAFDKSIKSAYFQASSFARSYIYLENQYFFYEEWASHLKTMRLAFMKGTQDGGKACQDARLLHLMAVIPKPEEDGMLPRTYDMLKSLGQGNSLPHQKKVAEDKWALSPAHADVKASASKVKEPTLNAEGVLMQDGKSLGLKTLICKMAAPNKEAVKGLGAARDIYIHSKLLMIDDSFMTLGSANMNQRSMAADSEINVATDSIPHTRALRQRVWGQQTGGTLDGGSGTPGPDQIKKLFKDWENLAAVNAELIRAKTVSDMNGFLVKFSHDGTAVVRVG
jgi:phosphatidylserine/phosphatidylglycerophosphate/cardiolipin synthase-like enzyme